MFLSTECHAKICVFVTGSIVLPGLSGPLERVRSYLISDPHFTLDCQLPGVSSQLFTWSDRRPGTRSDGDLGFSPEEDPSDWGGMQEPALAVRVMTRLECSEFSGLRF